MPTTGKYLLLYAVLINAALFTLVLLFTHPIYDTNEDAFVLYRLSGGFGNPPTELLHYNHGMHPYLGIWLKKLFEITNAVNWYTVSLLLVHFISCTVLLYHIFLRFRPLTGITAYLLLFIIFEGRLLLNINFSNTSLMLGSVGLIVLAQYAKNEKRGPGYILVAAACMITASFFREHILAVVIIIASPFLTFLSIKKKRIPTLSSLAAIIIIILLFNQLERVYYNRHIPNWDQEESYRQDLYLFYNNYTLYNPGPGEKWFTEAGMVNHGLPIDTVFLSSSKLSAMYEELKSKPTVPPETVATDGKNWIWINMRIFLCGFLLLLTFPAWNRKLAFAAAVTAFIYVGGFIWLRYNYKTTGYMMLVGFQFFVTMLLLFGGENIIRNRLLYMLRLLVAVLLMAWGVVRIYKVDQKNRLDNQRFRSVQQEIQSHPGKVFINSAGGLPFQKYYIMDIPKNLPLTNLLESEFFLHGEYKPFYKRLGITHTKEIPNLSNVFFLGDRIPALENYFTTVSGRPVKVVESPEFNTVKAYRILYE